MTADGSPFDEDNKQQVANDRVRELQTRELEKGPHLRERTVDVVALEVADGTLERITAQRLPCHHPPDRTGG